MWEEQREGKLQLGCIVWENKQTEENKRKKKHNPKKSSSWHSFQDMSPSLTFINVLAMPLVTMR